MTTTTATPAADTRLREYDDAAAEARLRQFCECFGLEMPKLRRRKGSIRLTTELMEFADREGLSLDWFIMGDPHTMAAAARDAWKKDAELRRVLRDFDRQEQRLLAEALKAHQAGEATLDEALARWGAAVGEHRANGANAEF